MVERNWNPGLRFARFAGFTYLGLSCVTPSECFSDSAPLKE